MLLRVRACAVCRTDLHVVDGELPDARLPLVPGHQIVGEVLEEARAPGNGPRFARGARVGVPWLGWTCGVCVYCRAGRENLVLRSVANLTRRDGEEFLALAPRVPVRTEVNVYPLAAANEALDDLRNGRMSGAAVLVPP
ncbi:alcohol dehydrogenase catalytic domain-containing protein [Sorangium sp. So ce117]